MQVPIPKNYTVVKTLGAGSQGQVVLISHNTTKRLCCLKFTKLVDTRATKCAMAEMDLIRKLDHPNIVKCVAAFPYKEYALIQMEYASGGDLHSFKKGKQFPEADVLNILGQLALGIQYLYRNHVLHRDIKPKNILLVQYKDCMIFKLADFGLSKELAFTDDKAKTMLGTPYYMSPECFQGIPYTIKSDIYSLGVILYELLQSEYPFSGNSIDEQRILCVTGKYHLITANYSEQLKQLCYAMISKQSSDRPSIEQIVQSDVLKDTIQQIKAQYQKMGYDNVE
ncbi:Kinase [Hexamita inflata]|uniref:non-specific serine/threonine protein kinase n=1 Tax=Hexamita inflata TaxID=28002 RepID=A0AA86TQE1_9EUKA|nr:Kinase [Hexamita inflata]